jgi:hypothetical protein
MTAAPAPAPRPGRTALPLPPRQSPSARFAEVLREDWPRLLLEIVVLVAGISLSFWLEGKRQVQEDRAVEERAWRAVERDLITDTLTLTRRMARLDTMVRGSDALLAGAAAGTVPEGVDAAMDQLVSYAAFTPTDVAFAELRQTSNARGIQRHEALAALTALHGREYGRAGQWDAIVRGFVLDRLYPYLEATAPAPYAASGDTVTVGYAATYRALAARPHFRNLLVTDRTFKAAQRSVYGAALERARAVLAMVRARR